MWPGLRRRSRGESARHVHETRSTRERRYRASATSNFAAPSIPPWVSWRESGMGESWRDAVIILSVFAWRPGRKRVIYIADHRSDLSGRGAWEGWLDKRNIGLVPRRIVSVCSCSPSPASVHRYSRRERTRRTRLLCVGPARKNSRESQTTYLLAISDHAQGTL